MIDPLTMRPAVPSLQSTEVRLKWKVLYVYIGNIGKAKSLAYIQHIYPY